MQSEDGQIVHRPGQGGWLIKDNVLTCITQIPGWLRSERQYSDFVLNMEYRLPPGGNSGLYVRTPEQGHLSQVGMEIQIADDPAKTFKPEQRTGSIFGVVAPTANVERPPGEWNAMQVRCDGNRVETTLNGTLVVSADMSQVPALRDRPRVGFVGLTNWKGVAVGTAFRNITIKEIRPEAAGRAPANAQRQADDAGFVPLFNGKDLTGWKTLPGRPKAWKVLDGAIVGTGALSYLFHERADFGDFHLRVEARINVGGDSSVFYRTDFASDRTDQSGTPLGLLASISGQPPGKGDATGTLYEFARGKGQNGVINLMAKGHEQWAEPGVWFTLEIVARKNRVTTLVEGHTVADHTFTANRRRGHFALQQNGPKSVIEFRKVEVKELPPGP
jgi:hypothetical protein